MIYSHEVEKMCTVAQGVHHGAAPIPEEAKWVQSKQVSDISGLTHGVGWCAAQYIQWSPFESQQPPIGIGRCTADVLNVRTGSGLDYPAAFQLSQGNMVDVLTASGQWLQINCLLGSGWCASQYIDWFRTNLQVPAIGVGKCTADVLNIRSGPATDLSVLFTISEGNMVDVLEDNGRGWLRIRCLLGTGWCSAQYIDWSRHDK